MTQLILGIKLDKKKVMKWALDRLSELDDTQIISLCAPSYQSDEDTLDEFKKRLVRHRKWFNKTFPETEGAEVADDSDDDCLYLCNKEEDLVCDICRLLEKNGLEGRRRQGVICIGGDRSSCCYNDYDPYEFYYGRTLNSYCGEISIPKESDANDVVNGYNLTPLYSAIGPIDTLRNYVRLFLTS